MKRALCLLLAVLLLALPGCRVIDKLAAPSIYTVTFDPDGGELLSGELTQKVTEGKDAAPPEVWREGWEFDGWDTSLKAVSGDMTAKAKWTKLYSVSFDPDGGELSGSETLTLREGVVPDAPAASREGCTFVRWEPAVGPVHEDVTYKAVWERNKLSAEDVYALVSPSLIEIHTVDVNGSGWLGSGFFIDGEGHALTNYHVMDAAETAEAVLADGSTVEILGVLDYNEEYDLCVVKVDVSGNSFVTISEAPVVTGQTVYALGNPLGLTSSFSSGMVSNSSRWDGGVEYIQTTAPISQGNSGGPLVDEYGDVVGVNTLTSTAGQNLNFAVKIDYLNRLDLTKYMTMRTFAEMFDRGFFGDYSHAEEESNDDWYLADELSDGVPFAGAVSNDDDEDWYLIQVASRSTAVIYIQLYDEENFVSYDFGYYDENNDFVSIDLDFEYAGSLGIYYAEIGLEKNVEYYLIILSPDSEHTLPVYYAVEFDVV